ncbi:MAG TPA: ribose 5-phosphate isomerase B [Elusimicrobia bacterium]|nr:ribose 5-phosphate isomerase B [Elusimicrobiota bacterium]
MRIALGCDHAGFDLKRALHLHLEEKGHTVINVGTDSGDAPVDYPDYARKVARALLQGDAERGVVVCGSGVGACIAANKFPGIRAGVCHDTFSARQCVEDDDANVLCLGSRVIGSRLAFEILDVWTAARFSGAERHQRRLDKVLAIEKEFSR